VETVIEVEPFEGKEVEMAKSRVKHSNNMVLVLAVCAGSALLGLVVGANRATPRNRDLPTQTKSDEKLIEQKAFDNEPLRLTAVRVKGIKVILGQRFNSISLAKAGGGQPGDWLENLQFKLENISGKEATFIRISLLFPDEVGTNLIGVYRLLGVGVPPGPVQPQSRDRIYTEMPPAPDQSQSPVTATPSSPEPLALGLGDSVTFRLSGQQFDDIKRFLSTLRFQLADLNRVWIKVEYVIFNDGTKWDNGHYFKRTPGGPRPWEPIDQ
jgi:hypothetical protein